MSGAAPPKRFYKSASIAERDDGWAVRLDGRLVRTPARAEVCVPSRALAEAIATEWGGQGETIDPQSMPLTRLANSALDGVRGREAEVVDDICAYAGTDLLCYRAAGPEALAVLQSRHWDPVLQWADETLGARLVLAEGVIHQEQPGDALQRLRAGFEGHEAFALAALHVITTMTGSALLALAHARGRVDADAAWEAAHVDEDWQVSQWGEDAEAAARRAARRIEFEAAVRTLALLGA